MPTPSRTPDPLAPDLTVLPPARSDTAALAPAPPTPAPSPLPSPPDQTASPPAAPDAPLLPDLALHSHRRRGKVARLPENVRDDINQMLLDGVPYAEILTRLGEKAQDLNLRNIQDWATGGFRDFLDQERRLEESRLWYELTLSLARQHQSTAGYQATPKVAVAQICEALIDCGPLTLRQALQQNPLNYIRVLNTLSRLIAGGLKCEQLLAEQAQSTQNAASPEKIGLSPEALHELQTKLRLM